MTFYRIYTGPKDSALYGVLTSGPYKIVMENNIDFKKSFNNWEKNMKITLSEPKAAYFDTKSYVLNHKNFKCKVSKNKSDKTYVDSKKKKISNSVKTQIFGF